MVREELFKAVGKTFTDEEFEDLCFEYGLEVEFGNGVEMNMQRLDGAGGNVDMSKTVVYKIEVPANRYDLLCLEGIATALRCYLMDEKLPVYRVKAPAKMERITVKAETEAIRPFVVGCILRNINFNVQTYNSFIDLQDKLHQNICRRRTIASMGTHDYDTMTGPVTYEAHPPKDIVFRALKQTKDMDSAQLFEVLAKDQMLKKYLHIIENKPLFPAFYDANRTVMSLPPIINSDATKISPNTKNVFIEITGTDLTKLKVVLNVLACQFSEHCSGDDKFCVEPVEIVYEGRKDLQTIVTPALDNDVFEVGIDYINKLLGITLNAEQMKKAGQRMGLIPV